MASYEQIVNSLIQSRNIRWTSYQDYRTGINFQRPVGSPAVVTYSFSESVQPYDNADSRPGFRPLTAAERDTVRAAIGAWDRASGAVLVEVGSGGGDIRIGSYNFAGTSSANSSGYAYYPGPTMGGDIWFNTNNELTPQLAMHEIGHSLGLKHPFDGGTTGFTLPTAEDKQSNTVMSYTHDAPNSTAIGPYDITAIQWLYGPDVSIWATAPAGYNPVSYLAANPDLLALFGPNSDAANNHMLMNGVREGRSVTFDGLRYLASYADLAAAYGMDEAAATQHYVQHGFYEGRNPQAFSGYAYLASYTDLQAAYGSDARAAEAHFINHGRREGRSVTFDAWEYLASNMDVTFALGASIDAGARHYVTYGKNEGRKVASFDQAGYLRANPDVAAAVNAGYFTGAQHFVQYGWREGRRVWVAPGAALAQAFSADALHPTDELEAPQVFAGDRLEVTEREYAEFAGADLYAMLSGHDAGASCLHGAADVLTWAPSEGSIATLAASTDLRLFDDRRAANALEPAGNQVLVFER